MNSTKLIFSILILLSPLSSYSKRNHTTSNSDSVSSNDKLDDVNENLQILAVHLTTLISSSNQTATNTASEATTAAAIVNLKNYGGANHDNSSILYWDYPLVIDTNTTGNIFKLNQNILFKPTADTLTTENSAIVITKDNVTIDLYGQTLLLDPSSIELSTAVCGIYIGAGVKGTQIISSTQDIHQKGTILDFTCSGITLDGNSVSIIKHTTINNINCSDNANGVYGQYCDDIYITNSHFIGNFHASNSAYGVYLKNVTDTNIESVTSSGNFSGKNAFGIYLENSINGDLKDCTANGNYSIATVTGSDPEILGSSYGIQITSSGTSTDSSSSNNIINCITNENYHVSNTGVPNQESVGIILTKAVGANSKTKNNNIENCTARRNMSSTGTDGIALGYGVKLNDSSKNEVTTCRASYNTTAGIIDTLSASTTYFTSNLCFFNGNATIQNYDINFLAPSGTSAVSTTIPIPTVVLHISDHIAIQSELRTTANIEIISD
jgi:parallel beta-helix repeat protein